MTWKSDYQDGDSAGIYGQLFDGNGFKIGSEFLVNTYLNNSQAIPSVASLPDGNFIVTWQSRWQDGSWYGIYGQLFNGNCTKIGSEFRANSYTTDDQQWSSVASFSNGNFVITWASDNQDGSVYGVYGQLFDGNGTKIGNEFRANSYTTNNQVNPSAASFSNGNLVVTWQSWLQDGNDYGIYGQLFNGNGTKIGSEFRTNSYTTGSQWTPSVASFSNGNFVVTWQSDGQDGSSYGVYGQLFDGNGTKIGSEFRANSYTTSYQWYPSVASFSNGNFVVTWHSNAQDGDAWGIYGQLFDGNGSNIGSEFRANSYTTSSQWYSSVASFPNDNFIVVWASSDQDGSDLGIYGQIFNDFLVSSTTSTTKTTSSTTSSVSSSTTSTTTTSSTTPSVSSSTTSTTKTTSSTTPSFSSTTSTTKTTSSTTPNVSNSTMSAIGQTRTSVNPSRSSTTVPSTTSPITTSNSRTTLSVTSVPSNRFSWIWFLLEGVGAFSCLGLTGYFIIKSRDRKKEGDVITFELEKKEQTDTTTAESDYQRTPDFVTAERESDYQRTPDFVTAERESDYQRTPDFVTAEREGDYLRTPDFVTAEREGDYLRTPDFV